MLLLKKGEIKMGKEKFEKRLDTAERMGFNAEMCLYEIQKELNVYGIHLPDWGGEIRKVFNNTVEVELAECGSEEERTKSVRVRGDGTGKFTSIKNIRFCLRECIEGILGVVSQIGNEPFFYLTAACFLFALMEKMGIELDKKQTAVIIALYQETKRCKVTDDNLEKVISCWLTQEGYRRMDMEEIYEEIEQLAKWGIIEVLDGRYSVAEKII